MNGWMLRLQVQRSARVLHPPARLLASGMLLFVLTATLCHAQQDSSSNGTPPPVDALAVLPAQPQAAVTAAEPIDFRRDIQPILAQRCVHCHGPDDQREGLRLDSRAGAEQGGLSGRPILEAALETNELYRRVASPDQTYRMPKREEALSDAEIDRIRRWVLEGCNWPDDTAPPPVGSSASKPESSSWSEAKWLVHLEPWLKTIDEMPYRVPISVSWLILAILTLVVSQAHKRARLTGIATWLTRTATTGRIIRVWLAAIAIAVLALDRGYRERALTRSQDTIRSQELRLKQVTSQLGQFVGSVVDRFGNPPIPPRMTHPKAVSRTYYRGNCERNPQLFNRGNYCTCLFHMRFCTRDGQDLNVGDRVPADGLAIRFEIERAPGSTEALFTPDTMNSIFLTSDYYERPTPRSQLRIVRLRETEPLLKWSCIVPIESAPDPRLRPLAGNQPSDASHPQTAGSESTLSRPAASPGEPTKTSLATPLSGNRPDGALFLSRLPERHLQAVESGAASSGKDEIVIANVSYVVGYDLGLVDGCLTAESDVWFGCLFQPTSVQAQPVGDSIPFAEWLDWRPLPMITGTNSTDPKLLGILDHRPDYRPTDAAQPPTDADPAAAIDTENAPSPEQRDSGTPTEPRP